MNNIYDSLAEMCIYIKDVLLWGPTQEEHDRRLRATLAAAQAAGIALKCEKCVFAIEEVQFLGDLISNDGINPDGKLVKCVASMPPPTPKQGIQKMVGAISYPGRFISSLSEV